MYSVCYNECRINAYKFGQSFFFFLISSENLLRGNYYYDEYYFCDLFIVNGFNEYLIEKLK